MQTSLPAVLSRHVATVFCLLAAVSPAATLMVATNADSGAGSLRQAIADARSGDTIIFDAALHGSVISLTSGQLTITNSVDIRGPGPCLLAIDGNAASRILRIVPAGNIQVALSGLSLTNGAAACGGAIHSVTAWDTPSVNLVVSNCHIRANRATDAASAYFGGGGITAQRNTLLTMADCEIADNHSIANGGGIWVYSQTTLERCLFAGNTTSASGGGLLLRDAGPLNIRNCTFSGNVSNFSGWQTDLGGGALFTQEKGNVTIHNSTFTGNATTKCCGGLLSRGTTFMALHSTLVAGNTDTQGCPDVSGLFSGITNSLIQATNNVALPGASNILGQPALLVPLADNGGLTRTHALPKGSPAIDKGYNPLGLATDQRGPGFPRQLGAAVDIGAFESKPLPGGTLLGVR